MGPETIFILLFVVVTGVAIAAQRVRIPYTVGLVIAGLLLGVLHAFPAPHLTKALLFSVFLPGLLFEAAFHLEAEEFWRNRLAIASLAIPGVIVATALTAFILVRMANTFHPVPSFGWHQALVFGALIAATDPVAVVAVFRSLGAPRRLSLLMEGESLLNDGTGIVFFTLSLAVASGEPVSVAGLGVDFVKIVGIGGGIGTATGFAVSQVMRQVDDPMIEITLTTITAYASFLVAEHFHSSGVIAAVCAGLLCGNYATRVGMSPATRVAVETFWEYVAFALNSVVFLLIGFEVHLPTLIRSWPMVLVAYLAVNAGRGAVILAASTALRPTRERIPRAWAFVLTWGGLRGGLPMVLVLSLPRSFAHRDLLVSMTFGVVLISILVHGLTMSPLLRWLGVVKGRAARERYEILRGRVQAAEAALGEVERLSPAGFGGEELRSGLREEYEARIEDAQREIAELSLDAEQIRDEERHWARRHLLLVEKQRTIDGFHQGTLSREAYERVLADIDARLLSLESGTSPEAGEGDMEGEKKKEEPSGPTA